MTGKAKGHLTVEPRARGRVWIAAYSGGASGRTRKTLGPAWVRDTGRKTARGATIWKAAPGTKPDATYLTPAEAQAKLDELLAEESKDATASSKGKTWGDAVDAWLDDAEHRRGVAPNTLRGYTSYFTQLDASGVLPRSTPLRKVTGQRLERAEREQLAAGLTRKTVHNRTLAIKGAHAFAASRGWTAPLGEASLIPAPSTTNEDFNVLTVEQVHAVARTIAVVPRADYPLVRGEKLPEGVTVSLRKRAVHQHTLELMKLRRRVWAGAVLLGAFTGLRMGELRGLDWTDVDLDGQALRVVGNVPTNQPAPAPGTQRAKTKGKRGRAVPLIPPALVVLAELQQLLEDHGLPTGPGAPVLPSAAGGRLQVDDLRVAFYDALAKNALAWMRTKDNPITLHDLRHTFGTLAARVAPLPALQAYLGHAHIKTTMIYAHHVPRAEDAAQLAKAFAPANDPRADNASESTGVPAEISLRRRD